jgi:hypothetical protein
MPRGLRWYIFQTTALAAANRLLVGRHEVAGWGGIAA